MEMDVQTISLVLSVIALSFSIVSTIISLFYARKRIKIVDNEAKRKQKIVEASETIRQVIRRIKENIEYKDFSNVGLDSAKDDILSYIHDNKLEKLELRIIPKYFFYSKGIPNTYQIDNLESLKKAVKTLQDENFVGYINLDFDCEPDIIKNKFIELVGPFCNIQELYLSTEMLLPYKNIIEAFDISILDELERTIDNIMKAIFESLMSEHQIKFEANKTSRYILRELERKLLDLDSVHVLLNELSNICEKLVEIQEKIFKFQV